ncbi:hypothetical protein QQ045_029601 [Rhodiola kirilowii]
MSDKSFNKYLHITKAILPRHNNYPSSYKEVKILLNSSFIMKAAVMLTISDFLGLGMLGRIKTKGYKDCPICVDEIDATHITGRMSYQGHRRWLSRDHDWRFAANRFNWEIEHGEPPTSLTEKNVFDNIIGTILRLEGKTKDDINARKGSTSRKEKVTKAPYTVTPNEKVEILELIKDAKYPSEYAGSLRNKINLDDKKFIGLKTHDCHVMLQRLLPAFIRPYLPFNVVNPLVSLSHWFWRVCCREFQKEEVHQMKLEIVKILCQLERIFPPAFCTIMVHLMIHLLDQNLMKRQVYYNWMYPMERQLGQYKKFVRNTRYLEGCITKQYIVQECVMYCKLYMGEIEDTSKNQDNEEEEYWNISFVSNLMKPMGYSRWQRLNNDDIDVIHWAIVENCEEAAGYINRHIEKFYTEHPDGDNDSTCHLYSIITLRNEGSDEYRKELDILAYKPQFHACYTHCVVNGLKFVVLEKDQHLKTQNSGVMVKAGDINYYGILTNIIELKYAEGMPFVIFKCKWYNTDPEEGGNIKMDLGIFSYST